MIPLETPLFIVSGEPASAEGANRPAMTLWGNQQVIAAHDHQTEYSAIDHDHDADYSPLGHDHAADYSPLGHDHDGAYAPLEHEHDLSAQSSSALGLDATNPLEPEAQAGKIILFGQQVFVPGDGNDDNTIFLLHGDTEPFEDMSAGDPTFVISHNGVIISSSAEHPFAVPTLYFTAGDKMRADAVFDIGQADFCVDLWLYPLNKDAYSGIFSTSIGYYPANAIILDHYNGNLRLAGITLNNQNIIALSNNTWHHIAVTRQSGIVRVFVGGALQYTATNTVDITCDAIMLGAQHYDVPGNFTGNIAEIRVVSGAAIWTEAFTPPTLPYGGGKSQVLKAKFENGIVVQLASMHG